jgi:hypothetical protein
VLALRRERGLASARGVATHGAPRSFVLEVLS